MMDSLITCPLCSQPRFPDVDSLWLTLIRASTRQLACPVCQEVLVGLDKLTIHLVSHSLHGHLVRACLASNLASTPLTLAKVGAFGSSQVAPSLEPNNQTPTSGDHKGNAPIASYILLNFPTLGISQSERYCEIAGPSCETDIGNENGDKQATCALSQELDFTSLLQTNSDKNNSITNKTASALPQNVGATNVNSPVKLNVPIEPLFTEQDISVEMSFSNASKDVPADKLCASKCMILSNQMSTSCGTQQSRMDNDLPVGHIGCPTFNNYVGCPISEKLGIARGFDDGSPSTIEDSSVSCGVCSLTFRDTNIAMLHQKLVHSQNHLINSQTEMIPHNESDDRNLSSKRWRGSSLKHVAGSPHRYPCHICNKVFRMRGSLMVHLRVAHSPSGLNLLQQLDSSSSKSQPSKQALIKNEGDVFCTSSDIDCSSVCTDNKTNEETPVSSLSPSLSPTCSPMTQAGSDESVCMVFPCNLCNKTYAKEALLTQHLKSHDSKQWECDVCFKSFTTKYFLKKHKRLHTGEMPYTCGICNKSFTFQQSYHKHLLYHSDEKPHSCTECGRAFKELSTLHNHQRIHTGEKPWACETCGKCFRQRVSYLVHRRIHTGAMPYQCTVCLKSFRYKVSQRTHKCITQATGDTSTQSGDLLQQLLQFPQKEVDSRSAGFSGEPHILLKEQLQHLNIKQENPQLMNVSKIAHPSREIHSNHFSNRDQGGFQSEPNLCNVEENLPSLAQPQTAESLVTSSGYSRFMGDLSQNEKQPSDFGSFPPCKTDVISNAPSSNSCEADPTAENSLLPTLEHDGNAETAIVHVPVSQPSLSSSVDFSTDLFQDILSMVMSPSSENVPSPSAQMRLLSISGAQNDNDLDSGLDLQQLLYGSCDSGNTP